MKKIALLSLVGLTVLILIYVGLAFFTVTEGQVAVLGPVSSSNHKILGPGLHVKWPWESTSLVTVSSELSDFALPLPGGAENVQLNVLWQPLDIASYIQSHENPDQVSSQLRTEISTVLTPAMIGKVTGPTSLAAAVLTALQTNPLLSKAGIQVQQVWVKGISPTEDSRTKIFTKMQGLAATVGQTIIANGEQQAEQIRNQAEQSYLQAQNTALQNAAKILGQGNAAAVKMIAPFYHQNPALFKAYVAAKNNLLSSQTNS